MPEKSIPPERSLGRVIGKVSALNVVGTIAAGTAGLLAARALGPSVKGEFAAVTAWFAWALIVGELGQSAAICYFVAHEPSRARDYLVTSRNVMLTTGLTLTAIGLVVAPSLCKGREGEVTAYRVMFLACPIAFVNASFLFAIQGRNIGRWMVLRVVQPVTYFLFVVVLVICRRLTLDSAVAAAIVSIVLQTVLSRRVCRLEGLLGGRFSWGLTGRVVRYGAGQMLSTTPNQANVSLDQLILSQTVAPGGLGQYSLAAALTSLAGPFVFPIGYVLFPRLASGSDAEGVSRSIIWKAVAVTTGIAVLGMIIVSAGARELIPLAFGSAYQPSVKLVWILAPSGVFFAVNQVAGDVLRGRGQPLAVAAAQVAGAALTITMLSLLIPRYGVTGAAITTSSAYGVVTVLLLRALCRRHPAHLRK